jgi:glucose-like phosphotransferase system IIB component
MNFELIIQYAIIVAVLLIIALVIVKLNHKDFNMDVNKLVKCLGGKDNILDSETTMSRFKVTLKDVSIVNKEGIQKLGAKGIVEIDNQLKIILGPNAKALEKYIDDLKK